MEGLGDTNRSPSPLLPHMYSCTGLCRKHVCNRSTLNAIIPNQKKESKLGKGVRVGDSLDNYTALTYPTICTLTLCIKGVKDAGRTNEGMQTSRDAEVHSFAPIESIFPTVLFVLNPVFFLSHSFSSGTREHRVG
jgi:hypothetical protein